MKRSKEQDHARKPSVDAANIIKGMGLFCVYAIGPEHGRPIKVGYATDVIKRLGAIQCHNWNILGIHDCCWVRDIATARQLEAACHARLDKRITGEWFDVSVAQVCGAMNVAIKDLALSPMRNEDMLRHVEAYREFVNYPHLFWPSARRIPDRKYAA